MKARLDAWLRRLGIPGILGIGLLLACAAFHVSTVAPAEKEATAQGLALERLRARTQALPVSGGGRAEELRRFYDLFPPAARLTDELDHLHRLARIAGLELAQGEYRLERRPAGLWFYRVTLPVRGDYAQIRAFLGAVLKDVPIASIDALRFERKKPVDTQLDAHLRLTIYVRPPGDTP